MPYGKDKKAKPGTIGYIEVQGKSWGGSICSYGNCGDLYPQAYIPKRHTLIQVLPPANAYTKSAHAYIHFAKSFCSRISIALYAHACMHLYCN